MLERSGTALKVLCGVLGALALYRLVLVIVHINPLYHVVIPPLPSLTTAAATNEHTAAQAKGPSAPAGTNGSHPALTRQETNQAVATTNLVGTAGNGASRATHLVASGRNPPGTNAPGPSTNLAVHSTNRAAEMTNAIASATNSAAVRRDGNPPSGTSLSPPLAAVRIPPGMPGMPGMPPGFPGRFPGGGPGLAPGPVLPPEIQSRVDRVIDSEILAPVMRPLPMALLGIAGESVFFRAPNGQTGLIKPGEEMGGVKLVRIGINRVLVEEQGEQKELTIFAGLGGESLLSNQKNSPK